MWEDEYGNKGSQCIYCETVYLIEQSDSNIKESFCCGYCEDEYKQFVKDLYEII
jgi:hypothetical protein